MKKDVYQRELEQQKKTIGIFIAIAVVITLTYGHILSWGPHAGSALVLQAGNTFGMLGADGYKELAKACVDNNKWDCAQKAYVNLFQKTQDVEVVSELAKLQTKLELFPQAAATFETYFKLGGKNADAAYFYGQVLETVNQDARAVEMYQTSIELNPQGLSINATSALVRLLMKQGRNSEARAIVKAFHEGAENAKGYLNAEAAELEKILGPSVRRHVRAKTVVRM
jgi:tetratricopeptide (TPR) repeat protein